MLIITSIYDTIENKRTEFTKRYLEAMFNTVDFNKHRIKIVNDGSCEETTNLLRTIDWIELLELPENVGIARALNRITEFDTHMIKVDNDVIFKENTWIDRIEHELNEGNGLVSFGMKEEIVPDVQGCVLGIHKDLWEKVREFKDFGWYGYEDSYLSKQSWLLGFPVKKIIFDFDITLDVDEGYRRKKVEYARNNYNGYLNAVRSLC